MKADEAWFVQLDCEGDVMVSSPPSCGRSIEKPCCHLQSTINYMQGGDTIYILQNQTLSHLHCNQTDQIKVEVRKSFILKTMSARPSTGPMEGVDLQGMQTIFNNNCTEHCSLTISESKFSCSFLELDNLDIWIKDTQFKDSFITAGKPSGNPQGLFSLRIQDSEFQSAFRFNIGTAMTLMNDDGPCKRLNFVCLSGDWNVVEIVRSNLEGVRQNQVSGVQVMHANIQELNLINVKVYSLFSGVVIWSSGVGIFNVCDSMFVGNRDGINIWGQGVRYLLMTRSEMNNTGPWFGDGEIHEKCNSALKGSAQTVKVVDSVFAHNRAYGTSCKGAALSLTSDVYEVPLLESNNYKSDKGNLPIESFEIVKSAFYENMVENCSSEHKSTGGGAVTIYGAWSLIKIVASTFVANVACKGGGIYISLSHWKQTIDSQIFSARALTSRIIIDTCTFNENIAGLGGGLMTELIDSMLDNGRSHFTLIYNSSFTRNKAIGIGAGAFFYYFNISLKNEVLLITEVSHTNFRENICNTTEEGGFLCYGGGIYVKFKSLSLMSRALVKIMVSTCYFRSNIAEYGGGGIFIWVKSCSLDSNSSIIIQTTDSTFISNTAWKGAGISASVVSCSVYSNSSIVLNTTDCTFLSNTAWQGAGIYSDLTLCPVGPDSSIMLHTSHSTFKYNTVQWDGAGIHTLVHTVSFYTNSSFIQQITDSTFFSNIAGFDGAGIHIVTNRRSIHQYALFKIQVMGIGFLSNRADRGAGLFLQHRFLEDHCVSGEVIVAIHHCRFLNNSASSEGGSLYFKVFLVTQISIKQSIFETNKALIGSGYYRENTDVQTCDNSAVDLRTHALMTTHITQCQFAHNIETAIYVKSKHGYGILKITECLLLNNRCVNSSFAEDVFTETGLVLKHSIISKEKQPLQIVAVHSQSDATLENVTVNTSFLHSRKLTHQRQINIALFSHYITGTNSSSLVCYCPAFYQPTLSTTGLSNTGAVMVRITCDACFEGYYIGRTWLGISAENGSGMHCQAKDILDLNHEVIGRNKFCYTEAMGTCIDCPHGANCSAGVLSLPNYWGHMTAADRLEFHRCPIGYCCNQAPCKGIGQCAAHREGTLCGRCMKGFSESLLSPECLPDENCNNIWLLPVFILWGFLVTQVLIFMGKLEKLGNRLLEIFRHFISKWKTANSSQDQSYEPDERQKIKPLITQGSLVESNCIPKVPILWGLLATQRPKRAEPSGSHKYLQIILYYLQDSALMQVDLAIGSTGSTVEKIRKVLLNVSQLAVDVLDLGLKLCPIQDLTPVVKLVTKNITGPLVFCFLFVIYGAINVSSKCCPNRKQSIRLFWYPKLTVATIFALLLFYQQIATTIFSLLYCIKSDNQAILFIDGTVTCFQPWQILVLIFAFNWVIAIIPVLMFLPGLLELRLISVTDFFLACLLPGPMLCYWVYRFYAKKFRFHPSYVTLWQDEGLGILQKTFVPTTYRDIFPFCWLGFMKIRRLAIVLIFTFVSNLVGRVTLMCIVIQLFLIIHLATRPYQDNMANSAYTASLLATLCIGLINIMKATCVEFYLDLDKVKHSLETLNMITDVIFVYCPPAFIVLAIIAIVWRKFRTSMRRKKDKEENKQE